MNRFFLFLLLVAVVGPASAPAQSDALSLADVQAAYDNLDGLRASFTQVLTSDFAGDTTRIDGTVLLSGNRYRVESPGQTVVTDGETTWIYTPADSQVVVNDADTTDAAVTPETFLRASDERYRIVSSASSTRAGRPHVKLEVEATDSAARFKRATLWVRRSDRIVTRMRATDRNGSTLDLRLRDLEVNPPLGPSPFRFEPPDGVDVVDLREDR
jgi:outer membrane lipoprotein carrier protein